MISTKPHVAMALNCCTLLLALLENKTRARTNYSKRAEPTRESWRAGGKRNLRNHVEAARSQFNQTEHKEPTKSKAGCFEAT